jgi:hypothetical protein
MNFKWNIEGGEYQKGVDIPYVVSVDIARNYYKTIQVRSEE